MKTYLHSLILAILANERSKGKEQFHSKNYLLEMLRSHVKMLLKSAPKKLNFVLAKAYQKIIDEVVAVYDLARSRIVRYSNAASFYVKLTKKILARTIGN